MTVKMNITMCNTMITIYELLVSNDTIFKDIKNSISDLGSAFEEFKNRINECYYG